MYAGNVIVRVFLVILLLVLAVNVSRAQIDLYGDDVVIVFDEGASLNVSCCQVFDNIYVYSNSARFEQNGIVVVFTPHNDSRLANFSGGVNLTYNMSGNLSASARLASDSKYQLYQNGSFLSNLTTNASGWTEYNTASTGMSFVQVLYEIAATIPKIIDWFNSKTGKAHYVPTAHEESVTYSVTSNQPVTFHFVADDVEVYSGAVGSYAVGFPHGRHELVVWGENENGVTGNVSWVVYAKPAKANKTLDRLNTTSLGDLKNATLGADFLAVVTTSVSPFTVLIGDVFFFIIFLVPFVLMWLRQRSVLIPSVLGLILGGVILSFVPPVFHHIAVLFVVLGVVGVVYSVYVARRG